MTPFDIVLWSLAIIIAIASLMFAIAIIVAVSASISRMLRKPKPSEPTTTNVFTGGEK